MRDRVITRAIIISVALHLVAISFVGRTASTRLSAASVAQAPQRLIAVSLVKDPLAKPKPVVVPPRPEERTPETRPSPVANATPNQFDRSHATPTPAAPRPGRVVSNSGGALNMGTPDRNGDLTGVSSGKTPGGWVPGGDSGRGVGSGSAPGVGTPEPPRPDPPRHVEPTPPPAPKRVTVRVCDVSDQLPGEHCRGTHSATFSEGDEPRGVCGKCKAPEPKPEPRHESRLADHERPIRTRYVDPEIPASVEEGQTFRLEIEYYVDTDGSVSDVRVTRSSGNRAIDREVTSKAMKWHYDPAVQNGVAQRVKVTQPMTLKS